MCGFFFFQSEEGIRVFAVTGGETCALPVFRDRRSVSELSAESASDDQSSRPMLDRWAPCPAVSRSGDRKSVVEGKSVELGGGRIIKKKEGHVGIEFGVGLWLVGPERHESRS